VTPNAHPAVMTIQPEFWPSGPIEHDVGDHAIAQNDEQHGADEFCEEWGHEAAKVSAG
jgi:hypothetical protein